MRPRCSSVGQLHSYFFGESFLLRRLLHALARGVEFPAVKAAANAVVFDPARGKCRLAMGTAKLDDVGIAGGTAIEREIFAHDADRFGPARL